MKLPDDSVDQSIWFRSPELISRTASALLIVDLQEKVLARINSRDQIIWNADRLVRASQLLDIPRSATEQYPQGLGATVQPLRGNLESPVAKQMFSCRECDDFLKQWNEARIRQIVVVGIETHVCILQTVLDLLAAGFSVYVPVDAVGARGHIDHETALRRMEITGASLTTTESILFEWCESSLAPEFKQVSQLVREQCPEQQ